MATFIQSGPVLFLVSLRQTSPQYMKNKSVSTDAETLKLVTHLLPADTHGLHGLSLFDRHLLLWSTNPATVSYEGPVCTRFSSRAFHFSVRAVRRKQSRLHGNGTRENPGQDLVPSAASDAAFRVSEIVVNESVTTLLPFSPNGFFYFFKIVKILHKYPVNDKVKIVCLKFLQTY